MLDYVTWICQIDCNSTIANHPSIGGPATNFIFSNRSKTSYYGVSNQNVFDVDFTFDDIDLTIDDPILNPLAKMSELRFKISGLGSWYSQLVNANSTDDTLFANYRVRLWATDCLVPGLVRNLASPTGWVNMDGVNTLFTATQPYTKDDSTYLLFDGIISDIQNGFQSTSFIAESDNLLRGKSIGDLVVGRDNKIAPFVIGDMTDSDAYIPAVFPDNPNSTTFLVCADGLNVDSLWLYSSQTERFWQPLGGLIQSSGVLYGMDSGFSGTLSGSIGGTGGGDSSQDSARASAIDGGDPFYYVFGTGGTPSFEVVSEASKKDAEKSRVIELSGTNAEPYFQGHINATRTLKTIEVSRGLQNTTASVKNAGSPWVGYIAPKSAYFTIAGTLKPLSIAFQEGYDLEVFKDINGVDLSKAYGVVANSTFPLDASNPPTPTQYIFDAKNNTTGQVLVNAPCSVSGNWVNFTKNELPQINSDFLTISCIAHTDWISGTQRTCASFFSTKIAVTWEEVGFNGVVSQSALQAFTRGVQIAYDSAPSISTGRLNCPQANYEPSSLGADLIFGDYAGEDYSDFKMQGIWAVWNDGQFNRLSVDLATLTHSQRLTQSYTPTTRNVTIANPNPLKTSDLGQVYLVARGVGYRYAYPDSPYPNINFLDGRTFTQQTLYELHFLRQYFRARVEVKEGQIFSKAKTHAGGATLAQAMSVLGVPASITGVSGAFVSGVLTDSPKDLAEVVRSILFEQTRCLAVADRNSVKVKLWASGAVVKTFSASNILLSGDNLPDIDWATTQRRDLVTSVIVRYAKNQAKNTLTKSVKLDYSGASATSADVSGSGVADAVAGLFSTYNKVGVGKTLTIDCDWIRTDAKAVDLAVWIADQTSQPRYSVKLKTHLKEAIGLTLGDLCKIDLINIPARLLSSNFAITSINFSESTEVSITLTEVI
jgi:hypothetical protein